MRDDVPENAGAAGLQSTLRIARGFAGLTGLTLGLIVLGALVRAHEAGLACPDWPLCFGKVIPKMNLEVAFEWSHRVLAGTVSLLFVALAFAALRIPAARRVAGAWIGTAAAILAIQILLGALTVWQLLASWTVSSHLVAGNAFAVMLLLIAVRLRRSILPERELPPLPPAARTLVGASALLLLFQMVVGGLVSSTFAGLACPEWPTCNGGAWFPSARGAVGLHLLHRTNGYLVVGLLGATALAIRRPAPLSRAVLAAFLLSLTQVGVGVANVLLGLPVEVTGLHSALASGIVLTLSFAVHETWTSPRPGEVRAPSRSVVPTG
jgi:cytochrome c oxidase assembly protein subunit 15